jgi:hypothetical protein
MESCKNVPMDNLRKNNSSPKRYDIWIC